MKFGMGLIDIFGRHLKEEEKPMAPIKEASEIRSNIDQFWMDPDVIIDDIVTFADNASKNGGPEMVGDIIDSLETALRAVKRIYTWQSKVNREDTYDDKVAADAKRRKKFKPQSIKR